MCDADVCCHADNMIHVLLSRNDAETQTNLCRHVWANGLVGPARLSISKSTTQDNKEYKRTTTQEHINAHTQKTISEKMSQHVLQKKREETREAMMKG